MNYLKWAFTILILPILAGCRGRGTQNPSMPKNIAQNQTPLALGSQVVARPVYSPQAGTPKFVQNFLYPDFSCNYTGVGGQVFDISGKPVTNLIVQVAGTLSGNPVVLLALTGASSGLGPGGFDLQLANLPTASSGTLSIQLYDSQGTPLTNALPFDTYASCDKNFTLINFVDVSASLSPRNFVPAVRR